MAARNSAKRKRFDETEEFNANGAAKAKFDETAGIIHSTSVVSDRE